MPVKTVSPSSVSQEFPQRYPVTFVRDRETTVGLRLPGVIDLIDVRQGQQISKGQAIARVADLDSALIAKAAVPLQTAARLHVGSPASVWIDPGGAPVSAKVLRIGAASDPRTGAVLVDLSFAGTVSAPSGAVGSVEFTATRIPDGAADIVVPAEALLDSTDGIGHVFVLDRSASVVRRVKVTVLGFSGEQLKLRGLSLDARIVTAGAGFVHDGQSVREVGR